MKKILNIIILLVISLGAQAQEKEWNLLKHNKDYICGEGVGQTKEEADKNALANLISSISVVVKEQIDIDSRSKNVNGELDETSQVIQSISTYSSLTLNNTRQFEMFKDPNWRVGRAIKVAEIENMFRLRALKARDMVASAEKAVSKGRIDDALRNYYWALTLLKSLQFPNAETCTDKEGKTHILTNWIKECMSDIFDDTEITCVAREGDDVEVDITYKDKPVNSAGFTYFDGRQWTSIVTANDGYARLEFVKGYNASEYKVRLEYKYVNEAKADKELESVLNVVNANEFPRSEKKIKGIKAKKTPERVTAPEATAQLQQRPSFTSTNAKLIKAPAETGNKQEYLTIMQSVEQAIRMKSSANIQQYFTSEGLDIYERLVSYGQAKIVGVPTYKFLINGDEVTARGQMLSFSFKNGTKKSFVEEVIYTFDANRKITNIAFGLGRTAEDDILNKGAYPENARMAIMNFLENYKTAYALKRLDYIQSIFDEDAIIITGRIVKKSKMRGDMAKSMMSSDKVQYNKQTKQQYMENLRKCFATSEFVNIHFANNDVRKGKGEVYGIQLEQDYHSSSYGDHGYLFLLVDMTNAAQPLIKIRTWQPERDPNIQGGIYSISDFKY